MFDNISRAININNIIIASSVNLATYLETIFDKQAAVYLNQNVQISITLFITLLVLTVLLQIITLGRVRESSNSLKKVVKNFPVDRILRNYGLKLFLIENPEDCLNKIKSKL